MRREVAEGTGSRCMRSGKKGEALEEALNLGYGCSSKVSGHSCTIVAGGCQR